MPCHDTLHLYRPAVGPATQRFGVLPLAKGPSFSDIQELAGKGRLHTIDDEIVLLIHNPILQPTRSDKQYSVGRAACPLNDEPVLIYVPMLMRPWVMQAWHSTASCHLGTTRTLRMLAQFYWWIGMNVCIRWWLRHCFK